MILNDGTARGPGEMDRFVKGSETLAPFPGEPRAFRPGLPGAFSVITRIFYSKTK